MPEWTVRTGGMRRAEWDSQNGTGITDRTGPAEFDRHSGKSRIEQAGQDMQNRQAEDKDSTRLPDQAYQERNVKTGLQDRPAFYPSNFY
jgi:hypothetical protein